MGDVINMDISKYVREGQKILHDIPYEKTAQFVSLIANMLLHEIKAGIDGEKEGPLFQMVDAMYDEISTKGCYFCDNSIDGNEQEFNTAHTNPCMPCSIKVANLLKAFGINHHRLFPAMGPCDVQKFRMPAGNFGE